MISNSQHRANITGDSYIAWHTITRNLPKSAEHVLFLGSRDLDHTYKALVALYPNIDVIPDDMTTEEERENFIRKYPHANIMKSSPIQYDLVLGNPPYQGTMYADFVAKAQRHLKPNGKAVMLMPASGLNYGGRKSKLAALHCMHLDRLVYSQKNHGFLESETGIKVRIACYYYTNASSDLLTQVWLDDQYLFDANARVMLTAQRQNEELDYEKDLIIWNKVSQRLGQGLQRLKINDKGLKTSKVAKKVRGKNRLIADISRIVTNHITMQGNPDDQDAFDNFLNYADIFTYLVISNNSQTVPASLFTTIPHGWQTVNLNEYFNLTDAEIKYIKSITG